MRNKIRNIHDMDYGVKQEYNCTESPPNTCRRHGFKGIALICMCSIQKPVFLVGDSFFPSVKTNRKPRKSFCPVLTLKHLELIWVSFAWPRCGKSGSGAPTNEQRRKSCSQLLPGKAIFFHDYTTEKMMQGVVICCFICPQEHKG